ncbi:MAG: SLBB domain-containing protein, partial [Candidatus Marinimicrobia bacterium]|nr:SLBB domain-containing protein [Candidatus Neomarinimicrobiota bacterium]
IFSILDLRQNIVEINGAVVRPGRFDIGESLQLRDLVLKADSLVGDAYIDRVDVVRFNPDFTEKLLKLNLGLAMKGDPQHNIQLEPMDRVTVFSTSAMIPRRFVTISGHVKTPGDYLLMENMTLYDLIFIAGGITDEEWKKETFLGRADLIRLEEDNITRTIIPFNLGAILNNPEIPQNLKLLPGDDVRVYSQRVFNAEKPVTIEGIIKNPGQYSLKSGMNLKDLILEAGGLSESVYKYRIEVARIDPEKASAEQFAENIVLEMDEQFSISNIENNNAANMEEIAAARGGFNLQPYDHIAIRPDPYFSMQRVMTVQGAILYPGKYVILSNNETIASIVERAGGLKPEAYPEASLLVRQGQNINLSIKKAIQQPHSKHNFKVQPGDIITINVYPNVVAVFGEVNNPGMFKYTAGMSMRDCISQAGGYTTDANKNDVWIRYPSGDGKEFKRYSLFSPEVMDGSVITVARDESEEVDKTEVTKEIASILADFVQIALTLTLIANM